MPIEPLVRPPTAEHTTPTSPLAAGRRLEGRTIGSYRVISLLGQGGMGSVYLAEHALIGRKAAIKVLNPEIASDQEVVSRFFTEARAVNDIRHPNIVEVTDFGQFDGLYCIVMEYLEGETLAARLSRVHKIPEVAVVAIMRPCLSALGAAHDSGLVHRDIKPENIFLRAHPDYPDFVKLLDFGIAKLLGNDSPVGHHTKTGAVMGTPAYMSPEQCLGEAALDIRSDIYSLGVVIYQMLTGRQPFSGDTLGRLIVCHVSETPIPPCVLNPEVSRGISDVIMRSLQKKPKERFQTAREFREALERATNFRDDRKATPAFGIRTPGGGAIVPGTSSPQFGGGMPPAQPGHSGRLPVAAPGLRPAPSDAPTADFRAGRANANLAPAAKASNVAVAPFATPPESTPTDELAERLGRIVRDHISSGHIELPALSEPTERCMELALQGRLSFSEAASILNGAPPLRSRIMRLANSAAFPSLMPATTLELAIARLGTQGLYNALLEFAGHEALDGQQPRIRDLMRRIWPHALGTAVISTDVCQTLGHPSELADAYLAGLLAMVGKPIVGHLVLDIDRQMRHAGNRKPVPDTVLQIVANACHPEAGAAACRKWNLNAPIANAIAKQGTWNPNDPHALSNIIRFSSAYVCRLGLTFGDCNGLEVDRTFGEGRALLRLDDSFLKRVSHGFKERVNVLAQIRG